jgi:hypothetical protein
VAQRWNDLLFAHWPVSPAAMAALLPTGLELDTFDGDAWVGVVPFWMDCVRTRTAGQHTISIPSTGTFSELNLRTYVRSPRSGLHGVYFFSLDAASALAVLGARAFFHLPYFYASMRRQSLSGGTIHYTSRRLLVSASVSGSVSENVRFEARYRSLSPVPHPGAPGTLEHFLTERYCLFTSYRGKILVGHIHHLPWPLEAAEAEIIRNELPPAHGISLPPQPPLLHFSGRQEVFLWPLRPDR